MNFCGLSRNLHIAAPVMLVGVIIEPLAAKAQQVVPPSAALQSCSVNNAPCQLESYAGWFVGPSEDAKIEQYPASAIKPSVTTEHRLAADGKTKVVTFKGANGKYLAVQPNKNWQVNFVATSATDPAAQFIAVNGLDNTQGQVFTSFKPLLHPDRFLRHQGFKLFAHTNANTSLFSRDASWRVLNAATINTEEARKSASASEGLVPPFARTQPSLNKLSSVSRQRDTVRAGRVAFISSDGSAASGSRSVFTLRDIASGETILIPVLGNLAATRTEIYVRPGTYEVTPPAPSVNGYHTFYTKSVSVSRVTVTAGAKPAVVDFSIGHRSVPVAMRILKVGADRVTLDWEAHEAANVQSYVLVRTDGDKPAASQAAGTVVARGAANMKSAEATGLVPNRKYTFTLFSKAGDGKDLPVRSISTSTSRKTGATEFAYALAPNTIVADNVASLKLEPVSETSIRIALPPTLKRGSQSVMEGLPARALQTNGCVVGTPFLLPVDVAGEKSFYGLIDACEGPADSATSAIVNRDVALVEVFNYFKLKTGGDGECYDANTGALQPGGAVSCMPKGGIASPATQGAAVSPRGPTLPFGGLTNLIRDQKYWAPSGKHYLVFQADGNLVVYRADGVYVWGLDRQPGVQFGKIARVTWQADGNLAAYTADNRYVWSALTQKPDPTAKLEISADGVLQIIAGSRVLWRAPSVVSTRDDPRRDIAGHVEAASAGAAPSAYGGTGLNSPQAHPAGHVAGAPAFIGFGMPVFLSGYSASSKVSCEGSGESKLALNPKLVPLKKFEFEINYLEVIWDIEAGIQAGFDPKFEITGKYSCSLDLPSITIPIGGASVPLSIRLTPEVSGEASASLKVSGPAVSLTLGVQSKGNFWLSGCSWLNPLCSRQLKSKNDTKPLVRFERKPGSANISGTLTFRAGVDVNLGFGYDIGIARARTGLSLMLAPLSAELKAQAGTNSCASASIGYQFEAAIVAELYLPIVYDKEKRFPLYESGHKSYPGASFVLGDCGDDD